ncbi:MAG: hypothetical protein EOM19_05350 [Candidatus Moranbacteria bacterium]|nr:hypothetical protein [Candidatus Moranbacteria bacterium]
MIAILRKSFFVFGLTALTLPSLVSAQFRPDPGGTELPNSSIWEIIKAGMEWLLYLVAFFAVIAFVISGLLYLTSAGNEDRASSAKNAMIYAIIGVIVALLGLIILGAADTWLGGGNRF